MNHFFFFFRIYIDIVYSKYQYLMNMSHIIDLCLHIPWPQFTVYSMEILEVNSFSLSLVTPNLSMLELMAVGFRRIWECKKLRGFSRAS